MLEALTANVGAKLVERLPEEFEWYYVGFGNPVDRKRVFDEYGVEKCRGVFRGLTACSPIPQSAQTMFGSIIMPLCKIGNNVLINTGAQIDHHCVIGDHCHIAPGAILCGNVTLGEGCSIGAGAAIIQGVSLNAWTRVPAGSLVLEQGDIRRPVRMVPRDRANTAEACPETV